MQDLTAIVLTRNEEKNLPDCLKSLQGFARRVVVVDSGSRDRTLEIAREMGAEILQHEWKCYAWQFNWALDNARIDTEWVLRIDADERLTDAVKREAAPLLASPRAEGIHGITMEATFYLLGRAIRHGGAKKRKLMFFRFGSGRVEDRFMDEHTLLTQGRAAQLRARFDHYDFKSIDHFAQKLNWYATREVMDILRADLNADRVSDSHIRRTRRLKGGVYYRFPMFLRAFAVFFVRYILQLGFLDGKEGLIYHFMYSCMYRFLVDAKLHEAKKTGLRPDGLKPLDA